MKDRLLSGGIFCTLKSKYAMSVNMNYKHLEAFNNLFQTILQAKTKLEEYSNLLSWTDWKTSGHMLMTDIFLRYDVIKFSATK
jgi:hypothetical protein